MNNINNPYSTRQKRKFKNVSTRYQDAGSLGDAHASVRGTQLQVRQHDRVVQHAPHVARQSEVAPHSQPFIPHHAVYKQLGYISGYKG